MNYATIKKTDVANGPGIRVSLFVSGCTHRCKGCFNSEAWDFGFGQRYTRETEEEVLEALAPDYIRGLSLLGGEPMEPENRGTVLSLVKTVLSLLQTVRQRYPGKDIWCYTGYRYEEDLLAWAREERDACACGAQKRPEEDRGGADSQGGGPGAGEVTQLLSLIDVLVDGEFVEERKNLRLAFRGSENQRLIDLKESGRQGRTVCL